MLEDFQGNERFCILRRLGAGGMGIVYEALDRERNSRVALKTMRNFDPNSIYRFKVEFRSLAEISHENLLPLYELFAEDDRWFFTMELLEDATDLLTFIRGMRAPDPSSDSAMPQSEEPGSVESSAPTEIALVDEPPVSGTEKTAVFQPSASRQNALESAETLLLIPGEIAAESVEGDNVDSLPASCMPHAGQKTDQPIIDYFCLRRVFLEVAQGIRALHAAGKIHRDLKPGNVMVRADGRPVLLDFGLVLGIKAHASPIEPAEGHRLKPSTDEFISGTISYMAPEQALGAVVSDSSDWYAFGVMLFEALTGRLPFDGKGVKMIRAKVNQSAPSPSHFAPDIPADLDTLCVELLHRDPEARPSADDILLRLSGENVTRPLPMNDRLFVGRRQYLDLLDDAYARLERGEAGVLCVHGRSGVGKTALLEHFLENTVTARGGILLEGRCFEQESVPYKAVDNLIDALAQLLLDLPADRVLDLLPRNIQALARVFPVLRRVPAIAEDVSAVIANDPLVLRQQAYAAFGHLLTAISAERALVLYIDDLQWGDIDSAHLLSWVLNQQPAPRMILLLSYRSEYGDNECLKAFRRAWQSNTVRLTDIDVLPLSPAESRDLATRLLDGIPVDAEQIERIVEEARGSAFFVQELAEHTRTGLEWQSEVSREGSATAAAVDLDEVLWHRVQQLPEQARQLLEIIAIAGQPVQFRDLANTSSFEAIPQHTLNLLRSTRLIRSTGSRLTDEIETFHDRVRESVSRHLSRTAKRDYHSQLAEAFEANGQTAPETIASHLHAAESPRAAHFYELAGERAIQVLAFDLAEVYLKLAAQLAPTSDDSARAEERLVHFYTDTARFQEAYDTGVEAVARFGVKLPHKFVPPLFVADLIAAVVRTGRRKPSDLLDLPVMTNQRLIVVVRLIAAMAKAAYQVRPEICVAICTRAVNLCLANGNTPDAAIPYMVFGCIFLGGIMGRAKTGHEFGRLSLGLVEKFHNERQRAEVNFVVGYFGTSWIQPATDAEKLWDLAFVEGQRTGDLFHTGCAAAGTIQSMIMRGATLDEIEQRIQDYWPVLERSHLREPMTCMVSARRLIACVRSAGAIGAADDTQLLIDLASFGSRHFAHFHFLNECMLQVLTGRKDEGLDPVARSEAYLPDSKGLLNTPEHYFWSAMLLVANGSADRGARSKLSEAVKRFAKWSGRCPDNFEMRYAVLGAELARLRADHQTAMHLYDRAITIGQTRRTLHLLGLANQRAALLAENVGKADKAEQYREGARIAYIEWGAPALSDRLLLNQVAQQDFGA